MQVLNESGQAGAIVQVNLERMEDNMEPVAEVEDCLTMQTLRARLKGRGFIAAE